MAGIVTGLGLGLQNSSLAQLGAKGLLGQAQFGRGNEQVYVNAATGNLVLQQQDEFLASHKLNIHLNRTYNSQGLADDDNGDNWRLGYSRSVHSLSGIRNTTGSSLIRTTEDGSQLIYYFDPISQTYIGKAMQGGTYELSYDTTKAQWLWQDKANNLQEYYDSDYQGRLTHIKDRDGNCITLQYNNMGLIGSIHNSNGDKLYIDYDSAAERQANIVQLRTESNAHLTQRVRYQYDNLNRLTQVIIDLSPEDNDINDGQTYITHYQYVADSRHLRSVQQSDGSALFFDYIEIDRQKRISKIQDIRSDNDIRLTQFTYRGHTTIITDPIGQSTELNYNDAGQLLHLYGPQVKGQRPKLSYHYDSAGKVISTTDARNATTLYRYDSQGNCIFERDALGYTVNRTYSSDNKLLRVTTYTESDHEGPPHTQTTFNIYDAFGHARFIISPEGRVSEQRYDSHGRIVSQIQYSGAQIATDLAKPPTLSELNAWVSQQHLSQSQRVDTQYDLRGLVSQITRYGEVNETGERAKASTTHYIYDANSNLLQTIDSRGAKTHYLYDGLNRLISQTDALGNTTTTVYVDQQNQTQLTLSNGLTTISQYDRAGNLLSTLRQDQGGMLGSTHYQYDSHDRLRCITNPLGQRSYVFYDAAGRKTGLIDANGTLTEYIYNMADQLTQTISYSHPVHAKLLQKDVLSLELAQLRPALDTVNDRYQYTLYDQKGRLVQRIEADGAVSVYRYNAMDQLQETIEYAERLTQMQLHSLASSKLEILPSDIQIIETEHDRHSRQLYDADGLLLASLDGEGYLTEQCYDAAGRLTKTIRYATATSEALRLTGTLAQLRPSADSQDQHTQYLYDAQNHQIGIIDAEGYLTEYQYDSAGNKTKEVRYATHVDLLAERTDQEEAITYFQYDALGRVIRSEQQPLGLVSTFTYDSQGNLLASKRSGGVADVRHQHTRYDSQGRVIAALSGEKAAILLNAETPAQIEAIWARWGTTHRYDAEGRRIATITPNGQDGAGHQSLNYYDSMGRLTHTVNPLGELVQYHYDTFGQKVWSRHYAQRIDALNLTTLQGGDSHELSRLLGALRSDQDIVQHNSYNQRGQIILQENALGQSTRYAYDAFGLLQHQWDPLTSTTAVQTDYYYDRRGLKLSQTQDKGGLNFSSRQEYDAFGRILSQTDARGSISYYQYDRLGREIARTDPNNSRTQTVYDAFARKLSHTDALGYTTTWQYQGNTLTHTTAEGIQTISQSNAYGENIRVVDGKGGVTTYEYNAEGQLLKVSGPSGDSFSRYDHAGQQIETTDARGIITHFRYDAAGRVLSRIVDPNGLALITRYSYDAFGRTSRVIDARGTISDTQYDANGQIISVITDVGGLNLTTTYQYDEGGRKILTTSAAGTQAAQTTHYHYDHLGRRISETLDPAGLALTTRYEYDPSNHVITRSDPLEQRTQYVYDAAGQLIYTLDAMGGVSQSIYNANGHIICSIRYATALDLSSLPATPSLSDITARLHTTAADQSQGSVFDADGRVIQRIDAQGYVTALTYDANGNQIQRIRYANAISKIEHDGQKVTVQDSAYDQYEYQYYDAANRLTHSIDAAGYLTQYEHDVAGNVLHTIQYAQAVQGRLDQSTPKLTKHANDRHTYHAYDAIGRKVVNVESGYASQNWYDAAGNIIRTVRYAKALSTGQIATLARPYPPNQDLMPVDKADLSNQYRYDTANRLVESKDALGKVTQQDYDAAGQLLRSTQAVGTNLAVSTTYQYDAAGRQLEKTEAADSPDARRTRYQYDAIGNCIAIIDARGLEVSTQDTAWAKECRQTLGMVNAQGQAKAAQDLNDMERTQLLQYYTTSYTYNRLGKKISQTDALGNQTLTEYDAFGNVVKVTDPRGYSGYFYFDQRNQAALSVEPAGSAVRNQYDAFGKVIQITRYSSQVNNTLSVNTEPTIAVNPTLDQITRIEHDKRNLQTQITDAEGYSESLSYDAFGNKVSYTNKLKGVYHYQYDLAGRVTQETLPIQARNRSGVLVDVVKRYAYDVRGNLIRLTEAAGLPEERVTLYTYDALDRLTQTSLLNQSAQDMAVTAKVQETRQYDALGQVIKIGDANGGITKNWYNNLGKKIAERSAVGTLTQWDYDKVGNAITQRIYADPVAVDSSTPIDTSNMRLTQYRFDASNRLVATITPDQLIGSRNPHTGNYEISKTDLTVRHQYDATGNLIQQTDARGYSTYYTYDKAGRKTLEINSAGYVATWQYDAAGNISSEHRYANPSSLQIQAGMTADDILTSIKIDPTHDRISQFNYDRLNRVIIEKRLNVLTGGANGSTERISEAITRYSYNGLGKVVEQSDALNGKSNYSYDPINREIQRQGVGYSDYRDIFVRPTTDSEYNGLDQITRSLVRGENDATEADDQITRFEYGIGGLLFNQYDPTGARTAYQYTPAGQISRSTLYEYNGEKISSSYRYDAAGREIERQEISSSMRYETRYNAYGEVIGKRTGTSGTGSWQEYAEYDNAGRMIKSNSGGAVKAYLYDANGNPTLQIEAPQVDLRALSLEQIVQRNGDVFRTVTQYDQTNRVTDIYQPTMQQARDLVVIKQWITVDATDHGGGVVEVGPNQAENTTPASHPLANGAANFHGKGNIHYTAEATTWFRVNSAPNPALGADRHMWADYGTVTYILPDNYSGLGDGPFYVEVLMQSRRPRAGSPHLHVTPVTYGAHSSNIAPRADGRYTVSFHVPLDAITDRHYVNYQTILYKQTPYGNVVISPLSTSQYTRHTHDDYTATMTPNGKRWTTGLGAINYPRISFTGQPLQTKTLLMYYRSLGNHGWTSMSVPATVINGHVVPGSFSFDWSIFPHGSYEFRYLGFDGSGNVLNYQCGHFGTHATGGSVWQTPQLIRPAGEALIDNHGRLFIYNLDSSVKQASLRYRLPGGSWEVMQGSVIVSGGVVFPIAGRLVNGRRYEFSVEVRNSVGQVTRRSVGQFIPGDPNSLTNLIAYQDQPQIVHFKNQPLSATYGVIRHRKVDEFIWVKTPLTKNGAGQFYWDATSMVERGSSANYEYEYLLYNKEQKLINHAQGEVRLGDENKLLSHRNIALPLVVSFDPNNVKHYTLPTDIDLTVADGRLKINGANSLVKKGTIFYRNLITNAGGQLNLLSSHKGEWHSVIADLIAAKNDLPDNSILGYQEDDHYFSSYTALTNKSFEFELAYQLFDRAGNVLHQGNIQAQLGEKDKIISHDTESFFASKAELTLDEIAPAIHLQGVDISATSGVLHYRQTGTDKWIEVEAIKGDTLQSWKYDLSAPDKEMHKISIPGKWPSPFEGASRLTIDKQFNNLLDIKTQQKCLELLSTQYWQDPRANDFYEYEFDVSDSYARKIKVREKGGHTWWGEIIVNLIEMPTENWLYLSAIDAPNAIVEKGAGKDSQYAITYRSGSPEFDLFYQFFDASGRALNTGEARICLGVGRDKVVNHRTETLTPRHLAADSASKLILYYRPFESSIDYQSITIPRAKNGQFNFDVTDLMPNRTTTRYDYYYKLTDKQGKWVTNSMGDPIQIEGVLHLGENQDKDGQTAGVHYVISGIADQSITIHRAQKHNAFGEISQEIDGLGRITNFTYNTLGKLIQKQDPETTLTLENGAQIRQRPTTRYYYDLLGNTIATQDANGHINSQTLLAGSQGEQIHITQEFHADGGQKSMAYDRFGNLRRHTDEVARQTDHSYDFNNRLTRLSRANGGFDNYEYNARGQRIAHSTTADGSKLFRDTTSFDSLGRVTQTVSAAGRTMRYHYQWEASIVGAGGLAVGGWRTTKRDDNGHTLIDDNEIFGQTTRHVDLGGHVFNYTYNYGRKLIAQTGSTGQNIHYTYYHNGYIKDISDLAQNSYTFYEYDCEGNRTFEGYTSLDAHNTRTYHQYSEISYDELNRIKVMLDPKFQVRYEYDAVGNRRRVQSYYHDGINGQKRMQDYWYRYDSMNRFVVTMGVLNGERGRGTITAGGLNGAGVELAYNAASERVSAQYARDSHRETYTYDQGGYLSTLHINGQLRASRQNDLMGRTLHYTEYKSGEWDTVTTDSTYDADSLSIRQRVSSLNGEAREDNTTTYYRLLDGTIERSLQESSSSKGGAPTTINTYYGYEWWDEAKQATLTSQPYNKDAPPGWKPGISHHTYDVNGHLQAAIDESGKRTFRYTTNAQGLILKRDEIDNGAVYRHHDYYYLDNKRVGDVGNDGDPRIDYAQSLAQKAESRKEDSYRNWHPISSADFDQNYEPIGPGYPSQIPSSYTARNGDTLQSIARTVWGDSSLWYLLADANGLSGSETLVNGQVLIVPNKVTNIHNNSNTMRVYNPGEAIGNTSPTIPKPPPPPTGNGGGCGGIAMIFIAIVAIVVTVYTAGAAASAMGAVTTTATTTTAGTTLAAGTAAASMGTMAAGAAALSGGLGMAGFAAAMIGGAVGAIAAQGVAIATGLQDKFSWSQVAMAGIGAGVTTIAMGMGSLNTLSGTLVRATASNMVTQGISVAVGMQDKFSWTAVAAAGVGAAVGYGVGKVGNYLTNNTFTDSFTGKLAMGMGNASVRASMQQGSNINWGEVAASSFGHALGDQMVNAISQQDAQGVVKANSAAKLDMLSAAGATLYGAVLSPADIEGIFSYRPADSALSAPQGPATLRAANVGGSAERAARAQLGAQASQHDINTYTAQLIELNNISPRHVSKDAVWRLPDSQTPAPTHGLAVYGQDIALGEQQKAMAAQRAAAQQWSVRESLYGTNSLACTSTDGMGVAHRLAAMVQKGSVTLLPSIETGRNTVEDWYKPLHGFFEKHFARSVSRMMESKSWFDQMIHFELAKHTVPYVMAEGAVTGLYNAPNHFYRSGYQFDQAYDQGSWAIAGSGAIDFVQGALGVLPLLPLGSAARPVAASAGSIAKNRRILLSSNELSGVERASQQLLDAVNKKRAVTMATEGSDALRYLNYRQAEAAALGKEDIILRLNPSKAAVLEEFLHGTQNKLGIVDRLGTSGFGSAETHVKDFMIRHQKMLGLSPEDIRRLQILRDKGL
jgi:YD repeat-containing protein